MTDLRTAAQQALEAWDGGDIEWFKRAYTVMENLRAALAQQDEPVEPVAWECKAGGLKPLTQRQYDAQTAATKRHYTRIAPPQRKPLTDEEIVDAVREADLDWHSGWTLDEHEPNRFTTLVRAVEQAHGIKERR